MIEVEFINYSPELAPIFTRLNLDWIEKYFVVEPMDKTLLGDPQTYIIDKGGSIFFASYDGTIVGTFALIKKDNGEYELGKMAVTDEYQGLKIGNRMLRFCIEKARALKIKKLILYSNTKLQPAIHLYRKFGFRESPLESSEYKRSNIKMELDLN